MTVTHITTKWGDITPEMLRQLKTGYAAAHMLSPPSPSFELPDGQIVLTNFAKHMIEFCEANGLVAAGEVPLSDTITGAPIERGKQVIADFFAEITGIVVYSADHIAVQKGDEIIAIIGSPDLCAALSKKIGN